MVQELYMGFMVISLALAFGAQYGFNVIYTDRFNEKFKQHSNKIKDDLIKPFERFFIPKYTGNDEDNKKIIESIKNSIDKVVDNWQRYQEIKEMYNDVFKMRKNIFIIFSLTAFGFLISIPYQNIVLYNDITLVGVSYILFLIGFASVIIFGTQVFQMEDSMRKYETVD